MRYIRIVLFSLLAVLSALIGLAFALHNTTTVSLDLVLVTTPALSVGFWIILAFVIGGFMGLIVSLGMFLKQKQAELTLRRHMRQMEKELTKLRNTALKS